MRLALALSLAASLLPSAVLAQDEGGGLVLKPAVGLTWTDVTEDPATGDAQAKAGWQIGGTALFGEKLYLEAGAFYARKSTDITATSAGGNVDVSGVDGLRIPVAVGYHLFGRDQGSLTLRVFGGGAVFLVTSVDAAGLSTSDFESPTWGVFAGVGLDFLFLFADLAYEWSLTDLTSASAVDVGQSRSLFLNAGLKLKL